MWIQGKVPRKERFPEPPGKIGVESQGLKPINSAIMKSRNHENEKVFDLSHNENEKWLIQIEAEQIYGDSSTGRTTNVWLPKRNR